MTKPKVKRPEPETMIQAAKWDEKKSLYVRAGFCHRCAAQAAWGNQLGFSSVHPVCDRCQGLEVPAKLGTRAQRWASGTPLSAVEGDDTGEE